METNQLYSQCIQKQLEEIDLLSSIYCAPGELTMNDATVFADFSEFIAGTLSSLRSEVDFAVSMTIRHKDKIEVRVQLPNLYPLMENAIVTLRSALLSKAKEVIIKREIEAFIATMDKADGYVFQVLTWLQEKIEEFIHKDVDELQASTRIETGCIVKFERLWIYSHHIKNKTKRHEIVSNAQILGLTGFSLPGKPGVICVEGVLESTQEYWRLLKAMHWQKITIRTQEVEETPSAELDKLRRWLTFKEELFNGEEDLEGTRMGVFLKYLDTHNSGYMRKELFGFE